MCSKLNMTFLQKLILILKKRKCVIYPTWNSKEQSYRCKLRKKFETKILERWSLRDDAREKEICGKDLSECHQENNAFIIRVTEGETLKNTNSFLRNNTGLKLSMPWKRSGNLDSGSPIYIGEDESKDKHTRNKLSEMKDKVSIGKQ